MFTYLLMEPLYFLTSSLDFDVVSVGTTKTDEDLVIRLHSLTSLDCNIQFDYLGSINGTVAPAYLKGLWRTYA